MKQLIDAIMRYIEYIPPIVCTLFALLQPTFPFIGVCIFAILVDCYTAWRLAIRLKKRYPDLMKIETCKFQSRKFGKIIDAIIKAFLLISLAYLFDEIIWPMRKLYLDNIVAAVFCGWQFISILENISSESDQNWAKILQKYLVNKAERHLGMKIDELKLDNNLTKTKKDNGEH